ncbi:unnamed protein product [Tilletia laevis]|uniref:Uncharacterized protein n=2 Tax=Tilletia TaxID=13289 RepID=A0A177UU13_9BASI|nr:hypothetical protein CF336_g4500 [Tilletia laevis]KAE8256807.1 hypothetical protein A4X03_0g5035 [Tilletia caries]CAD6940716.1 unnamed protein product [Tilletia controversa]KAE8201474.1 hypothetical protein CF335_g3735 [Tilletia laevis]CAD6884553.1 unnamed protein product [Tilletia caries]
MLGDATGGRTFASPSRIRILLVPVGDIAPEEFVRWCDHVSSFETMRLSDVPRSSAASVGAGAGGVRSAITGSGLAAPPAPGTILHQKGEIHLSFVTAHDPSHNFLAPFNLHRQVLGVLGLASYDTLTDQDRSTLERMPAALRDMCPGALVHRVYAFDTGAARPETVDLSVMKDPAAAIAAAGARSGSGASWPGLPPMTPSASAGDVGRIGSTGLPSTPTSPRVPTSPGGTGGFGGRNSSGLVVFPAVRKDGRDVRFYLRTLLPNYVGALLDGLHTLVTGLEGMPLETPRETLDGLGVNSAAAAAGAAANGSGTVPVIGAGSGIGVGGAPVTASAAPQRKTMAIMGSGPTGTGRITKVKADYALLSGDLWTALSMYDKCLSSLGRDRAVAGGQDAVWYAGGLEGWAVARLLVARMGGDVESKAPNTSLPTGTSKEKDKKEREKEAAESPYAKLPWAEMAEALALAVTIYSKCLAPPSYLLEPAKSASNETPRDYTHPLIHASACISHARFLLAVWASEGWNGETFDQLMYGGTPPALANDSRPTKAKYMHFCKSSGVQRHEIATAASQALTNSIPALKPPMQIGILSALASLFGCVGFTRREAYLLRQVQAVVVSLIGKTIALQPRREKAVSSRLGHGGSASSNDSTQKSSASDDLATMIMSMTVDSISDTAESVLVLALQVCETLGIDLDQAVLQNVPRVHILCRASDGRKSTPNTPLLNGALRGLWAASPGSPVQQAGENLYEVERYPDFGWPEQQLALLRDTVSVAELFSDHVSVAFFSALILRKYHAYIAADEQERIIQVLRKTLDTAKWNGAQELQLAYWGPSKPLKGLEFIPMPPSLIPYQRAHSELRADQEADSRSQLSSVPGLGNPFFWNPVRASTAVERARLVQDERAEFLVKLQNPLAVHLDFTSIKLSTTGVAFVADEIQASIPPGITQTIKLSGTPQDTGKLVIRGCILTLAGCVPQEFVLPLEDDESVQKTGYAEALELHERHVKTKRQGLDMRPTVLMAKAGMTASDARDARKRLTLGTMGRPMLTCVVLPAQPRLRIAATSLRNGVLFLLEGQETTLRIQLANCSVLPVDYVRLQFQDEQTTTTLAALSEGELLPTAAYDAEWDILHRPTFSVDPASLGPNGRGVRIPAGTTNTIRVQVRGGKVGANLAQIHIDYGHVDGPGRGGLITEEARDFHTRRLTLPLRMEVRPVLDYGALAVLPAHAREADRLKTAVVTEKEGHEAEGSGGKKSAVEELLGSDDQCLLSFRMRNVHSRSVMVSLEMKRDGDLPPLRIRRQLAPATTSDFVFPQTRLPLSSEYEPVPSLNSARQYVVSRLKLTPAEENRARAKFWRTEEVYKRLSARWEIVSPPPSSASSSSSSSMTSTAGEIRLRTKRTYVAPSSVDVLSGTGLDISLSVCDEDVDVSTGGTAKVEAEGENGMITTSGSGTHVHVDDFVHVKATLKNRTSRALKLTCRFVPHPSGGAQDDLTAPRPSTATGIGAGAPPNANPTEVALAQSQILCARGSATLVERVQPWPLGPGQTGSALCVLTFASEGVFGFGAVLEEEEQEQDEAGGASAGAVTGTTDRTAGLLRITAPRTLLVRAVR